MSYVPFRITDALFLPHAYINKEFIQSHPFTRVGDTARDLVNSLRHTRDKEWGKRLKNWERVLKERVYYVSLSHIHFVYYL